MLSFRLGFLNLRLLSNVVPLRGLSEINESRYTTKLCVNNEMCGDLFAWAPQNGCLQTDEILFAIFSRDITRAAKASTLAVMVNADAENRRQNRTK